MTANTFDMLRELILRDYFLHSGNQALFIRERTPKDISAFMEIADVFTAFRYAVGIRNPLKINPVH